MQVPLELTFRGLDHSDAVEDRVREHVAKLDKLCDHINSCRVALERPHKHPRSGSNYRVRIDLRVAPGHEIVVTREPHDGHVHDDLHLAVTDAFEKMGRQVRKLVAQQRRDIKQHPEQQVAGVVSKLFEDYGFIEDVEGQEVYFHRNSVFQVPFEDLRLGAGVAFQLEAGDQGPQASTVRVMDARGHR